MDDRHEQRAIPSKVASAAKLLLRSATGLSLKLGLLSALVVALVVGAGAAWAYVRQRDRLIASTRQAAETQARLTLTGLQFAMLENNRTLLHDLVEQYARSAEVQRVLVTDATGQVAVTSASGWRGRTIRLPEDVCPTCALAAGAPQTRTHLETVDGQKVLRSVTVISNEARCHRCHPSVQRTLGTLGVDFSLASINQDREAMITWMFLWGAGVAGLVLLAVGVVVQLGALAPLRRLRDSFGKVSTELQDKQAQVDRQQRFLVDLLDQVEDGVAVLDRSLRVVAANQSYLSRVGCSRDELGRGLLVCGETALCSQSDSPADCPTRNAFRNGRLQKRIAKHVKADREAFVEVFASPILGPGGRVEQVVEVWRDVTDRVALQANLARSEQLAAVGVLASGFSHEIATPLGTVSNSIQGMLRILGEREQVGASETAALRQRLEVASREVFRCRDITRSLLELGRRRRTVRGPVQLDAVVGHMVQAVAPTAERQSITIAQRADPALPQIQAHVDQLEQVMLNLLMNAIEAMPQGGTLEVDSHLKDGGVEIAVTDSGPGVQPADRERIFEPFFTRKSGGTGLGLYLSRQIVEAHGGRLDLVAGAGRGARFSIFLPVGGGAA